MTTIDFKFGVGGAVMGRKSCVPVGDKFLPGTTAKRLEKLSREAADEKTSRKYQAAMHRKMGKTNSEIAVLLGEKYGTIRRWLADMHEVGIAAFQRRECKRIRASTKKGRRAAFPDDGHVQGNKNDDAAGHNGVLATRISSEGRTKMTPFVFAGADYVCTGYASTANTGEYIKFLDSVNDRVRRYP